ncbi:MAG: CHAT domain-containing protein, partial [Microcystaceae cyanobacterium]
DTPIELLILSACQTAQGDSRASLGLAGMAVRSGSRSTIATLWSINDQSTSELMVKFYEILGNESMSKAEALRQAQLSLINSDKYHHPYYWGAFILVGHWQ